MDSNQHVTLIQFPSELPELLDDSSHTDSSGSISSVSYKENSFDYGKEEEEEEEGGVADDDYSNEEEELDMDYRGEKKRSIFQQYWEKTGQEPMNLKQSSSFCNTSSIRPMHPLLQEYPLNIEPKSKSDPSLIPLQGLSPVSILRKRGNSQNGETKRRDSNVSFDAKVNIIVFEKEYWVTKGWSKFFSI